MSRSRNLILVASLCSGLSMCGQNVGINTTGAAPDPSAILDVSADSLGILIPRMNEAEMLAIPAPAQGLLVYRADTNLFFFWDGLQWIGFPTSPRTYNTLIYTTDGF